MINRQIRIDKPRKDIYIAYLQKIFAGAAIKISKLEILLLNEMKQNNRKWDSSRIRKNLKIPVQSMNNYKGKLVKKKLIVKDAVGEYVLNPEQYPWLLLPSNMLAETEFRLIIDFIVKPNEDIRVQEDNTGNSIEEQPDL
jgi:predicted transcriptional regulator